MSLPKFPCAVATCLCLRRRGDVFCPDHALEADTRALPEDDVRNDTAFWRSWRREEARQEARRLLRGRRVA